MRPHSYWDTRAARTNPAQGDLFVHLLKQSRKHLQHAYPASLAHARAHTTAVLAGTYQGPLHGLHQQAGQLLETVTALPANLRPCISTALAQEIVSNPLAYPQKEETGFPTPTTQLELFP
ncbi:MAG: hypothetical protein H6922_02315 [Pseudomonadaceae bacterium]|nr:hypothetical protein [Pseudomonadaceae bacterium]